MNFKLPSKLQDLNAIFWNQFGTVCQEAGRDEEEEEHPPPKHGIPIPHSVFLVWSCQDSSLSIPFLR